MKCISIIFIFFSLSVLGQNKLVKKVGQFHSINQLVLLNGSSTTEGALHSINGFEKNNWFWGIGVGIDYYLYRSIPVFVTSRYYFGKQQRQFFSYVNLGYSFNWEKQGVEEEPSLWWPSPPKYTGGMYYDGGLGYRIPFKKNDALLLNLGYSYKYVESKSSYFDFMRGVTQTSTNKYKLNRVAISVGWQF